jgi:hypothetical protein
MCARPAPDRASCSPVRARKAGDGRRSAARRHRAIVAAFTAQIGGELSESDRGLVEQASMLSLRVEQLTADVINGVEVDDDLIVKMAGASRRALSAISVLAAERKPTAGETLAQYAARRAAEREAIESDNDEDS